MYLNKKIILFLVMCSLMLYGCTNAEKKDKNSKEISKATTNNDLDNFTDKEIEEAKKIADAYYRNTNYYDNIKKIEYNLNTFLYKQHSPEYKKGNLITFLVYTKDTENPPREIALAREKEDGKWKVINEGY